MQAEAAPRPSKAASWLPAVALLVGLYLIYSPTFLSDYLMNDEWARVGVDTPDLATAIRSNYLWYGRGLFGLYQKLVYDFAAVSPVRIQLVRFVNFASFAIIALVLLRFLQSRRAGACFAFLVLLFLFAQPPFQGTMGYSLQLISNTQPAIWFSLLAFYLYFFALLRTRLPLLLQAGIVFLILMLAMQSTQVYAFFATVPLTYLTLTDWKSRKLRILQFVAIMLAVLLVSTVLYKLGLDALHARGEQGYGPGEIGLQNLLQDPWSVFLTALNPLAYWSAFKFWTFPYPLQHLPPLSELLKRSAAMLLMLLWLGTIAGAIGAELRASPRDERREVIFKWWVVASFLGLAGIYIVADSPTAIIDHRPHLLLTFVGIVIFSGAYALQVLAARLTLRRRELARLAVGALVILVAVGAQSGFLRNVVYNHVGQLAFMRSEMLAKDPPSYDTVIVVLPGWYGCVTEPCAPWFGDVVQDAEHLSKKSAYHYVLATIGGDRPFKHVEIVDQAPSRVPAHAVVVDWNKYVDAQRRLQAGPADQ